MNATELQKLYADDSARRDVAGETNTGRTRLACSFLSEAGRGDKVLDVGCGNGSVLLDIIQRRGVQVHGIDIGQGLLAKAKQNGYVEASQLDVSTQRLPYDDGEFAFAFCGECIEHIVDTDHLLCEINRVLKPGGRLVLTFPNICTPIGIAMLLVGYPPMFGARYRSGHVRDFTCRTMKIAFKNCGFKVRRMKGSDFFFPKIGFCLGWLAQLLPFWASRVVVDLEKVASVSYDPALLASAEMD
jgi:SAM-dependent methyltransferase